MRKSMPERRRKNANVGACWWASGSSRGQKGDAERKGKEAMRPDSEHKAALAGLECSSKDFQTKSRQKSQENNGRRLLLKTNKKKSCLTKTRWTHGTLLNVMWQPGWQGSLQENGCMCMCLLCTWTYPQIAF